jgi:hypothetical protein
MKSLTLIVSVSALLAGCLEPLTSDVPVYSPNILPANTEVPLVADDSALAERIRGSDGVSENPVPRRAGFAAGAPVLYWDYGVATRFAITEYRFYRCDENDVPLPSPDGDVDHPPILDQVPGEPAYGPLFRISKVCVTDLYRDEVLPSRHAIEDAIALGLVSEPAPTTTVVHMPILASDVTLNVAPGLDVEADQIAYYRGMAVRRFLHGQPDAATITLPSNSTVLRTGRVYRLKKTGDAAYAETVFSVPRRTGGVPNASYTPIWRVVTVTMNAMFTPGSAMAESDLFTVMGTTLTPVHPNLTSFVLTDQYVNLEIQLEEGNP